MKDFNLKININVDVCAFDEGDVENQYWSVIKWCLDRLDEDDYSISIEKVGEYLE